jgi:hypothetical protein
MINCSWHSGIAKKVSLKRQIVVESAFVRGRQFNFLRFFLASLSTKKKNTILLLDVIYCTFVFGN